MRRRDFIAACCCALCLTGASSAEPELVEPHMRFAPVDGALQVAITLDACMGETDARILGPLIENAIPATLFVTARWLEGNAEAIRLLRKHADLFVIENHGARHVPAVIGSMRPYGLEPAGTAEAVLDELRGGAEAISHAFGTTPRWYRDATALYSRDAMALIEAQGFRIAGFSLNGDLGASAAAKTARQRIAAAKGGDVIIAHMNQPHRAAGAGVIEGILDLKGRGAAFVHLDAVAMSAAG